MLDDDCGYEGGVELVTRLGAYGGSRDVGIKHRSTFP